MTTLNASAAWTRVLLWAMLAGVAGFLALVFALGYGLGAGILMGAMTSVMVAILLWVAPMGEKQ